MVHVEVEVRVVVEIDEERAPADDKILDTPERLCADEGPVALAEHQRVDAEDGSVGGGTVRHEEVGEAVAVEVAAGGAHREAGDVGAAARGDLNEIAAVVAPELVLLEERGKMPAVVRHVEILVAVEVDVAEDAEEGAADAVDSDLRRDVYERGPVVAVEPASSRERRSVGGRVRRHVHVEVAVPVDVRKRYRLRSGRHREG